MQFLADSKSQSPVAETTIIEKSEKELIYYILADEANNQAKSDVKANRKKSRAKHGGPQELKIDIKHDFASPKHALNTVQDQT